MLCGKLAQEECSDCFKDPLFSQTGFKLFCETCSAQVCLSLEVFCLCYQSFLLPYLLSCFKSALIANKLI